MGEPLKQLLLAFRHIELKIGKVLEVSRFYKTEAWGNTAQDDFINVALSVESALTANDVMDSILGIEKEMGRIREEKWGPRIIDIDIIFFNDEIIKEESLTIPHPYLQDRKFVLIPLMDIARELKHPILMQSIKEINNNCTDNGEVVLL